MNDDAWKTVVGLAKAFGAGELLIAGIIAGIAIGMSREDLKAKFCKAVDDMPEVDDAPKTN